MSAAVVGFAFFLMELVWYRMLAPLLGGTVFTFGLILVVALLGIGIGGALYAVRGASRRGAPTASAFAYTCALEAICIAVPYALGDRLALLALMLRPVGSLGFGGFVLGWSLVTAIVVLPAAIIAGFQFPLLIGLLGRGRENVAVDVGRAYAWNTAGAIAGALAGGFGLIPLLSARGCWRLTAGLVAAWGVVTMLYAANVDGRWRKLGIAAALSAGVLLLLRADGPTAAWRHSSIGAGRASPSMASSPNAARAFVRESRAVIDWEADGVESSVAIYAADGLAFIVNGKNDGHARADAGTQVMSGLLGAMLHPNPKTAMVIGLGTGSTAGWLGRVPSIDRVDVVELEPAILEMARRCAPVNEGALTNPKVHVIRGDGREALSVTPEHYDLVFSEPSNPYRAGIASLYTEEFYRSIASRLRSGGVFVQWMQAYEIDGATLRTVYATLASVFPSVETWQAKSDDLLLVASAKPLALDVATLRARMAAEPYARALRDAWRVSDVEGFFGHYVARPSFARALADAHHAPLNTDDRAIVEFGFAKSVGRNTGFDLMTVIDAARARGESLPADLGSLDASRIEYERATIITVDEGGTRPPPNLTGEYRERLRMQSMWSAGNGPGALAAWLAPSNGGASGGGAREATTPLEQEMVAELLARHGDLAAARVAIEAIGAWNPAVAEGLLAVIAAREAKLDQAVTHLEASLGHYRTDPWPLPAMMRRIMAVAETLARLEPHFLPRLMRALEEPFVVNELQRDRLLLRVAIGRQLPLDASCVDRLRPFEPSTPWTADFLEYRRDCYARAGVGAAARAEHELNEFRALEPSTLGL